MRRFALVLGLCLALIAAFVVAQEAITVNRAVVCTGVADREPAGVDTTFADTVTTLYCFTELDGAEGHVIHTWYHGDQVAAEITLNKGRSGRWRTWSTKKMSPEWKGAWRVEVKDENSALLKKVEFTFGQ